MQGEAVLEKVVDKAGSDLILFMVVVAVILIAAITISVPFFKTLAKKEAAKIAAETKRTQVEAEMDNAKLDKYIQREAHIIQVVQDNTKAITILTGILEGSNKGCEDCKAEQFGMWKSIDKKLDAIKDQAACLSEQFDHGIEGVRTSVSKRRGNV